jgi:hypothetical protein
LQVKSANLFVSLSFLWQRLHGSGNSGQLCPVAAELGSWNRAGDFDTGQEDRGKIEATAWELVTEELERKKMELCQKNGESRNSPAATTAPSEQPENANPGVQGGKGSNQPKPFRGKKQKFLRSAGVGSIIALLRAQQAL